MKEIKYTVDRGFLNSKFLANTDGHISYESPVYFENQDDATIYFDSVCDDLDQFEYVELMKESFEDDEIVDTETIAYYEKGAENE